MVTAYNFVPQQVTPAYSSLLAPAPAAVNSLNEQHSLSNRVVMVTGGAGFIGCHTVAALLASGENVLLVDNLSSQGYTSSVKNSNLQWLLQSAAEWPGTLQIEHADITDRKAMKPYFAKGINVVCHLAACAGARESIQCPELYINTNVSGSSILLELAATHGCTNFVCASSGSVYGSLPTVGFNGKIQAMKESDPLGRPLSPYAVSKVAAEAMAEVYHHLYKMPTTVLRFFTVYGPRGRPEMAQLKFMSLMYKGLPIEQFGDGRSWRDYTYIDDVVVGILAAINKPHNFEVFNIGAGRAVSLSEFIQTLEKVMECNAVIIRRDEPKGDIMGTLADIQKAQAFLGYNPKVGLEEGLRRLFIWFKETMDK